MNLVTTQTTNSGNYCSSTSCKLPLIVTQKDVSQTLGQNQLSELYRYGKMEKNMLQRVEDSETLVNELADNLRTIKASIEKAFNNQILTQIEIEKCPNREQLDHLLQLKCRQQQDLMECLKLEDKYLKELNCAQRAMREIRVQKQSFEVQLLDKKIDNVYQMYESQKDLLYQNRLYRECVTKIDMKKYKFQAMKDYLNTSIDQSVVKLEQKKKPKAVQSSKDSMKRIRYHIRNTNLRHRHMREEALLKDYIRQTHQRQNLLYLKKKIEEQRENLCVQNQLQRKKRQQLDRKMEARRQELFDKGENPYVVDEMIKFQEQLQKNEMQVMQCKALALQKIKREIAQKEQRRQSEIVNKKKWDKLVSEKKRQHYNKYIKPFLAQPSRPSRQERWLRVAKDTYGYDSTGTGNKIKCHVGPLPRSVEHGSSEQEEEEEHLGSDTHRHRHHKKKSKKSTDSHSKNSKNDSAHSSNVSHESSKHSKGKKSNSDHSHKSSHRKSKKNSHSSQLEHETLVKDQIRGLVSNEDQSSIQADHIHTHEEDEVEHILPPRHLLSEHSLNGKCDITTLDGKMTILKELMGHPVPSTIPSSSPAHKRLGENSNNKDSPVFSWSPKIISFKNFELGKVYKIKVFVTNKSKERVKYYFKNMTEIEGPPPSPIVNSLPSVPISVDESNHIDSEKNSHHHHHEDPIVHDSHEKGLHDHNHTSHETNDDEIPLQSTYTTWPVRQSKKLATTLSSKKNKSIKIKHGHEHDHESGRKLDHNHQTISTTPRVVPTKPIVYKLSDLIKIDFTIPPPISPGLQHSFLVKFTPKIIGDWSGTLHFTSEIESFDINLEIRKKIFSPQLEMSTLTYNKTVVQTSILKKVKIKNVGGLPGYLVTINEPNPPKHFNEMEYYATPVNLDHKGVVESSAEESENEETEDHKSARSKDGSHHHSHKHGDDSHKHSSKKSGHKKKNELDKTDEGSDNHLHDHHEDHHHTKMSAKKSLVDQSMLSGKKHLKGKKKNKHLRLSLASSRSNNQADQVKAANRIEATNIVKDFLNNLVSHVADSVFVGYIEEMQRKMEPGESLTFCVLYRPPFLSNNFVTKYDFSFEQESGHAVDNLILDVTGRTVDNPVYIQPMNGDFKICMINQTYQMCVHAFTNSHKGSGKVSAKVPTSLRGLVDVHPQEGTVFGTNPCQFSVKFRPKKYILTSPERFGDYFDPETNIIDFPIYFHLKFPYKVPSPIKATFMGIISDTFLIVEPLEIDVGHCLNNQTVRAELSVYNPTSVTQQFGFVDVPEEILIQPNYGFGNILPAETIKLDILLSMGSKSEGHHNFLMKLETLTKEEYNIRINFIVRNPIAKLSHNKVFFPVTCCGSTSTTFIGIKASPKLTKGGILLPKYRIDVDPSSPVRFIPNSGYLEQGKEMKIMIIFEANVTDDEVKAHYVESARKRYYERMNLYQRELSSINLHIKNDWMLEENLNMNILQSRVSLLSTRISNQELSAALQKIALRKLGSKPQDSQTEGSKLSTPRTRTPSKNSEKPSSHHSNSTNNSKSSRRQARRRKKEKNDQSTKDSVTESNESNSSKKKNKKRSTSSTSSKGKSRSKNNSLSSDKSNDKKVNKKDAKTKRDSNGSANLPLKKQILTALEKRKISVQAKLEEPFIVPDVTHMSNESVEFAKAKRDLMRNLVPTSKVCQIPIFVEHQLGHDILYLTVKCPFQKPDLILLDDSSTFNFGLVEMNNSICKEISLYNISSNYLKLKMDILNPYGPFLQVNVLRDLAPEHVYTLKIRFEPRQLGDYEESIIIYGMDSRINVTLKGSCGYKNIPESVKTSVTHLEKHVKGTPPSSADSVKSKRKEKEAHEGSGHSKSSGHSSSKKKKSKKFSENI